MRAGREIHLHLSYARCCALRKNLPLTSILLLSAWFHFQLPLPSLVEALRIRIDKGGRSVVHPPRAGHPVRHRWVSSYPFLLMVIITCQSPFPWSMGTTASVLGQFSLSVVVHVETGLLRSHWHKMKPAVTSSGTLRE